MSAPVHWTQIPPHAATKLLLPDADIVGPINELDEPCPWPWEPEQLIGAPMGQYHCNYCLGMQMAGLPHLDCSNDDPGPPGDDDRPLEDWPPATDRHE